MQLKAIIALLVGIYGLALAGCQSDSAEQSDSQSSSQSPSQSRPGESLLEGGPTTAIESAVDLNNRASSLFGTDNGRALVLLNQALEVDPTLVETYVNKTTLLMQMEQFEEALETVATAKTIDPGFAELYTVEGMVFERLDKPQRAIQSYEQAVEEYGKARYDTLAFGRDTNVALLLTLTDSPAAALAAYDKMLNDPTTEVGMLPILRSFRNAAAVYQGGGLIEFFEPGPMIEYCVDAAVADSEGGEQRKLQEELLAAGINTRGSRRVKERGKIHIMIEEKYRAKAESFGLQECE